MLWIASIVVLGTAPVDKAERLYQSFEYERAIRVLSKHVEESPGRDDPDAHRLLGQCFAVLGRISEAESAFERLLELEPELDLPDSTPPKILLVFRKVRAEVLEARRMAEERRRRSRLESIEVTGQFPETVVGGTPVDFEFRLQDPTQMVGSMSLMYRQAGDPAYSSLALESDGSERWRGTLPGELTANEAGLTLQFYAQTFDEGDRPLVAAPPPPGVHSIDVSPGEVSAPYYETVWFWATVGAVVLAAAGTTTAILLAPDERQADLPPYTFPP